ncbi:hypothetical protein [Mariniblastus fucicola]|nr:hypothetical protein [Mariniblastus fucicola]
MFTLVAVATSYAQSVPEPAVVISLAPVKEQMNDVNYLVDASGFGQAKFLIKSQIKYITNGIDTKRPAGVLLYFEGDNPQPRTVIFLPVKDFDELLDTVSNVAEVDDEDDVIKILPSNGETLYAVEKGDHVFITMDEESLSELPEDPQSMLGDMPSKYNLAAHVYGGRVPDELRQKAVDLIKDGYLDSLQNMGTDPDQIDQQIADFEEQIKAIKDIDEIVFGMVADEESHKMAMEFTVTGKPGSKVAKSYAGFANADPTRFAGFMNDAAALDYNMCFNVDTTDADKIGPQMDTMIESMMTELDNDGEFDDEEMDTIRSAAVQIAEVVEATFKEGRIDSGGQLLMGENDFNFVAGGQVADPKKVESAAKELIGLVGERAADAFKVNLDFASHNGVTMHEIIVNIPEDEEELQDFVGSELVLLLGIGDKDVYLAAGKNPMDTLKAAMDGTGVAPEFPVIYNLRITPILEFAASTTGQPMLDGMVDKLKEVGRDKMTVYSKAIENGLFTRMEMEDGALSLIQEAMKGMQGGGGAEF